MEVIRDGIAYNVIHETDSEVYVEAEIKYYDGIRMIRCWWDRALVSAGDDMKTDEKLMAEHRKLNPLYCGVPEAPLPRYPERDKGFTLRPWEHREKQQAEDEKSMKAMIKKGAIVSQDFSVRKWRDDTIIFTASDKKINGSRKCVANGYGSFVDGENYGNGAVYVEESDLIPLEVPKRPDPYEIWAAAQLMPGEGIEDGVRRISEIIGAG